MPRLFGSPALAPSGDGRLELFIFAIDGSLWHLWQTAWSNGWSGWASAGGAFGEWPAAIARNGDGRLITLAVGGALEQIEQTSWSNGWSGWTSLGLPPGGMINPPTVAAGADGRLILFASSTGQDGPPRTVAPGARCLGRILESNVVRPFSARRTAHHRSAHHDPDAQGQLQVFVLSDTGVMWNIGQTAPAGPWTSCEFPRLGRRGVQRSSSSCGQRRWPPGIIRARK